MAALVSFAGVPESWRGRVAWVAAVTAVAVGVTGYALPASAEPSEAPAEAPSTASIASVTANQGPQGDLVAPDAVAAQVNARLAGERVEDVSARTELSSTFANPDGTWTQVQSTGPVWVRAEEAGDEAQVAAARAEDSGAVTGGWVAVDSTLTAGEDGWFAPVAQAGDIQVSGARAAADGVSVVARLTDPETGVRSEVTFPGDLPEPQVAGPRATYRDVADGVDMVVEVTGTGVEQFFVLTDRPEDVAALDLVTGLRGRGVAGVVAQELAGDGVAELVTAKGEVAAQVATPVVWDAVFDAQRANPVTEDYRQEANPGLWAGTRDQAAIDSTPAPAPEPEAQTGTEADTEAGRAAEASAEDVAGQSADLAVDVRTAGASALVDLTVPGAGASGLVSVADFVADPDVVFPVVVDPAVSLSFALDTYVQSDISTSKASDVELRLGTYDGSAVARSYLTVNTGQVKGKKILSATLSLWEFHSYSCTAASWQGWSLSSLPSSGTTWANKPAMSTQYGTSSATKGYSSACAAGWVTMDLADLVQAYANNSASSTNGLGLRATSETSTAGWKKFNSGNATSGKPTFEVTFNSYPDTPGASNLSAGDYAWWPSSTATDRQLFVRTTTPTTNITVSDPDGGQVRSSVDIAEGSTSVLTNGVGTYVTSGSKSVYKVGSGVGLTHGRTYSVKAYAYDKSLKSKAAKALWTFTVDTASPSAPTITSTGYAAGEWKDTKPSTNVFTVTSSSTDAVRFEVVKDGKSTVYEPGARTLTLNDWNPGSGAHTIKARALDKAGNPSAWSTVFSFGNGGATLSSPSDGLKSTDTFVSRATGPSPAAGATATAATYYRVTGLAGTGDEAVNGSDAGWKKITASEKPFTGSYSATWSAAAVAEAEKVSRGTLTLQVQVCIAYSGVSSLRCTWNSSPDTVKPTVVRVPHAFGDDFPTAEAGPGQVALWTGEFNTSATDVSVPGYVGDLSVSRSYATLEGQSETSSVFGPGWKASFDGTDVGVAGFELVDNTDLDGTIALIDAEGGALVYRQPGGTRTKMKPGQYTPVDTGTGEYGARLVLQGSGVAARVVFTEDDGTVTTFAPVNPAAGKGARVWNPASVTEPGSSKATTFTTDPNTGLVERILAPVPDGVTCPASGTLNAGCRALDLVYSDVSVTDDPLTGQKLAAARTETRLTSITYTAYDPATKAMSDPVEVATYSYDAAGRLAAATDPLTELSTNYAYSGASTAKQPLLVTVKEPGRAAWRLGYGATSTDPAKSLDAHALLTVKRDAPVKDGDQVQVARFVYGVDLTGGTAGLPEMTAATTAVWGQAVPPVYGAAVFGQDKHELATSDPTAIAAGDWPYANLQYTDDQGRVLVTSAFGAGDWQHAATRYDAAGRPTHTFDPGATAQLRAQAVEHGVAEPSQIDSYATITRYNDSQDSKTAAPITWNPDPSDASQEQTIAADTVLTETGTLVTDTWAPAREVDGVLVREHSHTDYDEGAPNQGVNPRTGVAFRLPTTATVTQADGDSGSADLAVPVATGEPVLSRTENRYAPIDGNSATHATSGWMHGQPTETTQRMGANGAASSADITNQTRYDAEGRTVEVRKPRVDGATSPAGADAATTKTTYYTAGPAASNDPATCGGKPQWAGLTCQTRTGEATPTLPVETVEDYSFYLAPARVVETLGATERETTTAFGKAGRIDTVTTTVTGLSSSAPVPVSKTLYDEKTGDAVATVSLTGGTETGRVSGSFDLWGRPTSYTDTDGKETKTTYDTAGRVWKTLDPTGRTTTYGYDGDTATGTERRGLPTSLTVTGGGANVGVFTAAYDPSGNLVTQSLPSGRVAQRLEYGRAGELAALAYDAIPDGATSAEELLAWTIASDVQGNISTITSSVGAGDGGIARTQAFTYDPAQRLTRVEDTIGGVCTTRAYEFDQRGNRTGLTGATHAPGDETNPCDAAAESTTMKTWRYDDRDQVQTGASIDGGTAEAYGYDALGRQTLIPAADTPTGIQAGSLSVGYYDTDAAHTLTQDGLTTTYTLDPAGRRTTESTNGTNSAGTSVDERVVRHYTDSTDNPGWAVKTTATTTTASWYGGSVGGDLGVQVDTTTTGTGTTEQVEYTLVDPLGSLVTTYAAGSATPMGGFGTYDEYGNTLQTAPDSGALDYGWLVLQP